MNRSIFRVNLMTASLMATSALLPVSADVFAPLANDITEPAGIYFPLADSPLRADVKTVIGTGACVVGNYVGCTLADVYADNNSMDDFKPEVKVHITMDTFPDDGLVSNATLRQRGNSAREADQKSYRIKLDSKKTLWRGERKLQLNKHPWDLSRINNKLSFDLMQDIPHLTSLRTDFVNLFVDNVDYGLFTHVENVGKEYLKRRGWNKDSGVYKANSFSFYTSDAFALDSAGKPLDPIKFEAKLEIKRGKDHRKLLEMMNAVNDKNNNFSSSVLGKYFNKNNYLSWFSASVLMGNDDVVSSNFYLLNRKGEETFYFLPWDYDETWEATNPDLSRAWSGVSGYWTSKLHKRYLQQPGAIAELIEAVNHIKNNYFSAGTIASKLDAYLPMVLPLVSASPDFDELPVVGNGSVMDLYMKNYDQTYTSVQRNYQNFINSTQYPMGFWVDKAYLNNGKLSIDWTASYDLQGDKITYDIEISTSPKFLQATIVKQITGLTVTEYDYDWTHPKGDYYLRIIARDDSNPVDHWQVAYDEYFSDGTVFPGVISLQDTVGSDPVSPYCDMAFDPQIVGPGQEAELSWWIEDATIATINKGVGNVTIPTAEVIVFPTKTTTYALVAEGSNGSTTTCQATIVVDDTVVPEPVPPYCDMMFDPQVVSQGQETELSWWIEDATTAAIDNNIGNVAIPTAEVIIFPTKTTTYTLTAGGADGSTTSCQTTIVVK